MPTPARNVKYKLACPKIWLCKERREGERGGERKRERGDKERVRMAKGVGCNCGVDTVPGRQVVER